MSKMGTVMEHLIWVLIFFAQGDCLGKIPWTYDLLDIVTNSSTPEKFDGDLKIVRAGRGLFAISGTVDISEDLTDELFVEAKLARSATGSADYAMMPFQIPRDTLTNIMNSGYKRYLMPYIKDCAPDAPQFEDKFVAPLTKRKVILDKCNIKTENLPSYVQSGYYKLWINFDGQVDGYIQVYVRVENS